MKKGLSGVISTVLLIVIVLVIAAVMLTFFKDLILKQKSMNDQINSFYEADLYLFNSLPSLTYGSGTPSDAFVLGVKRKDNEKDVLGVRFLFEDGKGNSYSYDTYSNPPNKAGIINEYEIYPQEINVRDFSEMKKVSVSLLYGYKKATKILDEKSLE
jgi:flagellin-like protein